MDRSPAEVVARLALTEPVLLSTQSKMKNKFLFIAVVPLFRPDDQVGLLVLLIIQF